MDSPSLSSAFCRLSTTTTATSASREGLTASSNAYWSQPVASRSNALGVGPIVQRTADEIAPGSLIEICVTAEHDDERGLRACLCLPWSPSSHTAGQEPSCAPVIDATGMAPAVTFVCGTGRSPPSVSPSKHRYGLRPPYPYPVTQTGTERLAAVAGSVGSQQTQPSGGQYQHRGARRFDQHHQQCTRYATGPRHGRELVVRHHRGDAFHDGRAASRNPGQDVSALRHQPGYEQRDEPCHGGESTTGPTSRFAGTEARGSCGSIRTCIGRVSDCAAMVMASGADSNRGSMHASQSVKGPANSTMPNTAAQDNAKP